jgi:hypothetical protein
MAALNMHYVFRRQGGKAFLGSRMLSQNLSKSAIKNASHLINKFGL